MKTNELREKYLDFFVSKGHTRCPSDVLVPTWDPSVLFTPAGMNQFKDHFLGKVKLDFTRATTSQKCLRTGDIDNVGRTAYHHTFFEMLGNFSFGDYFKREAINWAWEFLTDKKWLGIDPDRLTVTVYQDEAEGIWQKDIGLTLDRIERLGEHDNFWPAGAPTDGPDGVSGPCSEIFYHPADGSEEVEIWNLVFTQFNRVGDPPNNLHPLPSKNIDTGMGLERAAATLQGVATNYHIDTLLPIVEAAGEVCGVKYEYESDNGRRLRRITDHMRACSMSVHENVYPGPQKEKYVIRRLLRRAVLDGHQMGLREPFLFKLVPAIVEQMKVPYPELADTVERVQDVIKAEESSFFGKIDDGVARIDRIFTDMESSNRTTVAGAEAAELYQTFGVPPEVFEAMAAERSLAFDWDGFKVAMDDHADKSGGDQATVMGAKGPVDTIKQALHETQFLGYDSLESEAEVRFVIKGEQLPDQVADSGEGNPFTLVLDQTPFYGESGGQVGDSGEIAGDGFTFRVTDTQKDGTVFLHHGYLDSGTVSVGNKVTARVDYDRRSAIQRAHSATHVLHFALQKNLGTHAQQQGSKVDADWLRFDFTNMTAVGGEELSTIESDVHKKVAASDSIRWDTVGLDEAKKAGAMMLFGEKYPDPVRMVSIGEFSKELCGGTHLTNSSDVGEFEIISEEGVSAGTRRIIALTGKRAKQHMDSTVDELSRTAKLLGVATLQAPAAAEQLVKQVRDLKKQLSTGSKPSSDEPPQLGTVAGDESDYRMVKSALRQSALLLNVAIFEVAGRTESLLAEVESLKQQAEKLAQSGDLSADTLLEHSEKIGETSVVVMEIPGGNSNLMRQLIDQFRKKVGPSAVLLAASQGDDKVVLVAGVSRDLVENGASAGNWVKEVAPVVGGGGGGKPDMAQAGGKNPEKLSEALVKAKEVIQGMLAG
jgi:alanyl-tRNA synthetase